MEGNIDATSSDKIPDPPSHFSLDDSLAKELLKLSFNEREAMQEEIHGVRCLSPEETPEMIERSLMEFDTILMEKKSELQFQLQLQLDTEENNDGSTRSVNVLRNAKSLFRVSDFKSAASQLPSEQRESSADDCYLNDPDVRLRFLRCDCFHPQKAVRRMVNFLELTGALFGEYVTERPIRITDFNTRKEEVALQNSRNQYLPFRDRSGRRVFVGVGSCGFNLDCRLRSKIMTFLHWMASEEVETQQKGVVIVAWPSDENSSDSDNSGNKQDLGWEKSIRPRLKKGYRLWQKKNHGWNAGPSDEPTSLLQRHSVFSCSFYDVLHWNGFAQSESIQGPLRRTHRASLRISELRYTGAIASSLKHWYCENS